MSEYKNRIREKRTSLGLSQRDLAKAAGTSQQQIQRIESGVQAARLDLAMAIATALNSSLKELYPKLASEESGQRRRKGKKRQPVVADETFLKAGIDADPRHWTVKIGFAGEKKFFYRVSASEKERISSILWAPPQGFDFVVFDTRTHRVAINRTQINYCNFLFDGGIVESRREDIEYAIIAHFIGTEAPERFGVEPDDKEPLEDDQGWSSQLQSMFVHIDGESAEEDEILHFDDEDGERVYLRTKQILSLEVPLLCCEPELWRNYIENVDEDDSDKNEEDVAPEAGANSDSGAAT